MVEALHRAIEAIEPSISKKSIHSQRPLPASEVVAEGIAFPGKIDPLRMAKLVTHKVEVALSAEAERQEPDDLVEAHSPADHEALPVVGHVPVHLLVHQPEGQSLVADERLVVALHVRHALFVSPSVKEGG